MKKQFNYVDKKGIKYVALVGEDEILSGLLTVKDMQTGNQEKYTLRTYEENNIMSNYYKLGISPLDISDVYEIINEDKNICLDNCLKEKLLVVENF